MNYYVSRSGKGWREEEVAFLNCSSEDHASRHCIFIYFSLFRVLVGDDDDYARIMRIRK